MRNPAALFFTAILPVIFLTLFVSIFGNNRAGGAYGNIRDLDAAGAGVHRAGGRLGVVRRARDGADEPA